MDKHRTVIYKMGRSLRFWAWFFRILLVLNLIPPAVIALYAHPGADDFAFSNYPHHAWEATHSILAFLGGCVKQFHWNYFSWQGCYSAVILGTLDPLAFGERHYVLVPYILIGLLVLSNFVFWRSAAFHLNGRREAGDIAASIACLAELELVPRAYDMFFWWDGSVNYLPFFCFLLLMGAVVIRYADERSLPAWLTGLAAVLSFVFVGGNYSTALMNFLLLAAAGAVMFLSRRPDSCDRISGGNPETAGNYPKWKLLPLLIILSAGIAGLAVSILAPGNAARVADEGGSGITSIPAAILTSIRLAVDSVQDNLSVLLLLFLAMAAPFLWMMCGKSDGRSGDRKEDRTAGNNASKTDGTAGTILRLPLALIYVILFLVYAAGFAPSVYVYGDGGPMRLEDVRFFYLVFFLMLAELATVNRVKQLAEDQFPWSFPESGAGTILCRYMGGVLALSVLVTDFYYLIPRENRETLTSVCAARSVLIGEAQMFDAEMKEREAVLNDPSTDGQGVTVQAVTVRPKLLFLLGLEMEEDPDNWINQTVAAYYDKASVTLDNSNLSGGE